VTPARSPHLRSSHANPLGPQGLGCIVGVVAVVAVVAVLVVRLDPPGAGRY